MLENGVCFQPLNNSDKVFLFMLVVYFEFQAQTLHSKELQRQSKKKSSAFRKLTVLSGDTSAQIIMHNRNHQVVSVTMISAVSELWSILKRALSGHASFYLKIVAFILLHFKIDSFPWKGGRLKKKKEKNFSDSLDCKKSSFIRFVLKISWVIVKR